MKIFKRILTYLFFGFIIFIFLKGCHGKVMKFETPSVYEKTDKHGQIDRIYLIQSRVIYSKNYNGKIDIAGYTTKSTNAKHYFGSIYNTGESLFSLKWISDAKEVWKVSFKLKDKLGTVDKSTFGEINSSFRCNLIEYENSIKLCGEVFNKINMSKEKIEKLSNKIKWK